MRLKSFRAATVAEAMQLVRDHFGDGAVIVSTQRGADDEGVRVTAAVEEPDIDVTHAGPSAGVADGFGGGEVLDPIDVISQTLDFHAVPSALADRLLGTASNLLLDDPAAALSVALDAVLGFDPLPNGKASRPLMLVGPPGSGKTVTTAKLAVRATFEHQPVHVITTDVTRAGGIEQLEAFTRLLKVELNQVDSPEGLVEAVGDAMYDDLVLIDSVACNPFNQADLTDLAAMLEMAGAEPVLVLPAGIDLDEARETAEAFRTLGCTRMLITRLDAARRFGSILNAANAARLNLCDYTDSMQVTEGIHKFNPLALARLLLPDAHAGNENPAESSFARGTPLRRDYRPAAARQDERAPRGSSGSSSVAAAPRPRVAPTVAPARLPGNGAVAGTDWEPEIEVDAETDAIIRAAIRDSSA